ncbi:Ku protein [Mesorhizobium sp. KR1-2]|uniref:Ku protein n=1 Tax=Mesorhizobium sp. KR1-2 TaxID=3156609 RepID=UPI0032B33D8E
MSTVRALWKGFLRLGNVTCGVRLTGAWTAAEATHFKTLNRQTREPVKAAYVDEQDFLLLEADEMVALKPLPEHVIILEGFVFRAEVDPIDFEKPYYLSPVDNPSTEPFSLLRDAMRKSDMAALATVVLFQHERHVLLEPLDKGILLTILRSAKEVVPASKVAPPKGKKPKAKTTH